MLPVTHGERYTRLQVLLYTLILFGVSLLPFAIGMSGWLYLAAALVLGGVFIGYAVRIYVAYSDRAGAAHLPLLDRLPRRAVRGAAR